LISSYFFKILKKICLAEFWLAGKHFMSSYLLTPLAFSCMFGTNYPKNLMRWQVFSVNQFYIFIVRAVLGAVFAVMLSRFFYPDAAPVYVAGLGIFLVGMAYLFESIRKKDDTP